MSVYKTHTTAAAAKIIFPSHTLIFLFPRVPSFGCIFFSCTPETLVLSPYSPGSARR